MKIAIHQPNYFPWLGYFIKMHLSDVFVFHDYVPISDRSYTRRCKIETSEGAKEPEMWLSLIISQSDHKLISNTSLDDLAKTLDKHFRRIESVYQKHAFFNEVFDDLTNQLDEWKESKTIAILNMKIISFIAEKLDIYRTFKQSSVYKLTHTKDEHNLSLVKLLEGSMYLSGIGAKAYQNETIYKDAKVQLVYIDSLNYLQNHALSTSFTPSYSILDALFKLGWSDVSMIIKGSNSIIE